jgi:hypothetical protein
MLYNRHKRWEIAKTLINGWWPPLGLEDGVSAHQLKKAEQDLSLSLPAAFWEWHQLAGQRQDFIGNEDYLLPLD